MSTRFAYKAIAANGEVLSATVDAPDRAAALLRLSRSNLTVVGLREAGRERTRRRDKGAATERALVLKQLSVMVRAGVELLEAVETIRANLPPGATRTGLGETVARLRRGETIATALSASVPDYPRYVGSLIAAGESSGQLERVLHQASGHLAADARARREIGNALTYPALLVGAGLLVITFLFYVVIPRFAAMLGPQRDHVTGFSDIVLSMGEAFHALGLLAPLLLVIPFLLLRIGLSDTRTRAAITGLVARIPGIRSVVAPRRRAGWARIMSIAIGAGVGILDATRLAADSVAAGPMRTALLTAMSEIRKGRPVADAMADDRLLGAMDISLVRVGQRTGSLAEMFGAIADYRDEELSSLVKRATVIVEQVAIALVGAAIGAIVVSLVSAMTTVYGTIQ
jgi:general secretion pathway protein F